MMDIHFLCKKSCFFFNLKHRKKCRYYYFFTNFVVTSRYNFKQEFQITSDL